MKRSLRSQSVGYLIAVSGIALATVLLTLIREHVNTTTVALALLLIVPKKKGKSRKHPEDDIHSLKAPSIERPCPMQNWRLLNNGDRRSSPTMLQTARIGRNQS